MCAIEYYNKLRRRLNKELKKEQTRKRVRRIYNICLVLEQLCNCLNCRFFN